MTDAVIALSPHKGPPYQAVKAVCARYGFELTKIPKSASEVQMIERASRADLVFADLSGDAFKESVVADAAHEAGVPVIAFSRTAAQTNVLEPERIIRYTARGQAKLTEALARAAKEALSIPPLTLCLCNRKGGVGKSTSAVNLANAFAEQGLRVLALDLDIQTSLSTVLARKHDGPDLFDALGGDADAAPVATRIEGVDILPSRPGHDPSGLEGLPELVDRLSPAYDLVLFDTSAGPVDDAVRSAWRTAAHALVPTDHSILGVDALATYLPSLLEASEAFDFSLLGVFMNMYEPKTTAPSQVKVITRLKALLKELGVHLFSKPIRKDDLVARTLLDGKGVIATGRTRSRVLGQYRRLADQVLARMRASG